MFVMVDYVKEITEKKSCKYDGSGSFEHLLLLCLKKRLTHWHVFRHLQTIFFKLGMVMGLIVHLISVWMTLAVIQCHSCTRNQKL